MPRPPCLKGSVACLHWTSDSSVACSGKIEIHFSLHLKITWPPNSFLSSHKRAVCPTCRVLYAVSQRCAYCKGKRLRQITQALVVCAANEGDAENPAISQEVLPGNFADDLQALLSTPPATLKHIPKASRVQLGQILTELIQNIASSPSIATVGKLILFTRFALDRLPRGGKRGRRQSGNIVSRRLDLWSRTPLSEIMVTLNGSNESLRSEMRAHKSQDDLTKLKLRIKSCLQEGAISKAAKELLSDGLHPWTPSVSQKLHELHPQKPLPPFRDSFADEVHGDCSPEELLGILKSFPLGSAPGPSGLRPISSSVSL